MRASFADGIAIAELPIGRLHPRTLQRMTTARSEHHRCGPWIACAEEFSRLIRVGSDLRLERRSPEAAEETDIVAFERIVASANA